MEIINKLYLVFILVALFFYGVVDAQASAFNYNTLLQTPLQYTVLRTSEKMVIDGKDDEKDWGKAPWTPMFTGIENGTKTDAAHETKCKMLWDNDYLYLYVSLKEPDLWASIRTHDSAVYHDNAFEMFIAPGGETYNYFEFQINAYGTVWDLFMPKPYRNGGKGLTSWDIKGLQKAVHLEGTLNNPDDTDKGWDIELAIPFKSVKMNDIQNPSAGTIWRMNFSTVQWQLDTLNGNYFRRKDQATGRLFPEQYSVWSPQGIINLHYPERYGYVLFSDSLSANGFLSPELEKLKLLLWKYYYLQQNFKEKNGMYATRLKQMDRIYTGDPGLTAAESNIKMNANKHQFWLQVFLPSLKECMSVDEEGEIRFEKSVK